jgi:hypothetical protein
LCRVNSLVSAILLARHSISKGGGKHLTQACAEPAYLDPNRGSLQKPIEGLLLLVRFAIKSMLKTGDKHICRLIANQCRHYRGGSIRRMLRRITVPQKYSDFKKSSRNQAANTAETASVVFPLSYPRTHYYGNDAHYANENRVEDRLICLPRLDPKKRKFRHV